MPILDLTASHLASKNFEPQRANNGLLRIFDVISDVTGLAKAETVLTLSLNGFGLPVVTVEAIEQHYLNEKRKVAGTVSFDDIEVTFKDFVDVNTAQICKMWHEQVYSPYSGKIGLASSYKKHGLIELFAPDGSHSRYYHLQGIWPTTYNPGAIDMTSAEPLLITMTLSIDKAYANDVPGVANLLPQLLG
jgi:hypothetical protein